MRAFIVFLLIMISGAAMGQAADLDQGENGKASSPKTIFWQNGNLGPSGAHFAEGYSIPYRMRISSLVGDATTIHTLIIEWDTKDQNGHALDYITHYYNLDNPVNSHQNNFNHGPEAVNPTIGTTFNLTDSLEYQIPAPSSTGAEVSGMPGQSFTDLPGVNRTNRSNATKMAIWGGTIVDFLYLNQDNQDATTASTKTQLRIRFRATNGSTALLAWGGHIAAEYDWGTGRGASKVNGSPYHMRLVSIDGKGGNQDRSLKADAVLVPTVGCIISATQPACEGTSGPLTYSVTGSPTGITNYSWTLTFNGTNARISGGTNNTTTSTISGANVTSISIVPAANTTFAPGTYTLSLTLTNLGGAGTPCTQTGTISQAATANANTDQTICEGSTVQLAGSVGGGASSGTWSTNGDGTFDDATKLNAVYTPGTLDKASATSITLTLTTNDPTGPCNAVSDFMLLTINDPATANAGDDVSVCASSPAVTLNGSVGGGASSGTWSTNGDGTFSPNATTLNATYTPGENDIAAGTVTLTLTTNDPNGPCGTASNEMIITITANPVRPVVQYLPPDCDETTFGIKVIGAVAGGTYTLTQVNGVGTVVKTYAADRDVDGNILFAGLTIGKGFSIVVKIGDCTSNATDCDNFRTTDALTQAGTNKAQSIETVTAKIDPKQSKVLAAPNPFSSKIRFSLESAVSGQGSLELFNMLGQKVKTVYQGYVKEGQTLNVEYNVPIAQRTSLMYVFRVGNQQVTGKLISIK